MFLEPKEPRLLSKTNPGLACRKRLGREFLRKEIYLKKGSFRKGNMNRKD